MKTSFRWRVATLAAVAISAIATWKPATAASFYETEVDSTKFIAVAAPFGQNSHQLLIIEQVSPKRECWSESGSNPVKVDPLLLNFDFTGICGRSTDSNGYSIRKDGQDLGTQYILRVVERNGELLLVGTNTRDRNAPEIIIGRTNGLDKGFLKINLEPDWRFTKRTLDGKVLGHVYLTSGKSAFSFRDIASDVYAKEIEQAVAIGFVSGFREDNTFKPQDALTREQLVSMVLEGLKTLPGANITLPTQATGRPYPDVDASRWSAAKIQWARDNKIISGYQDGTFKPTQPVTRAELVAVQRRAAEFAHTMQGRPPELTPKQPATQFSDTQSHWAASLISQMSAYCQVASPVNETGTAFSPNSQARRNYAAAATLRMLNCVKSETPTGG
jgi:N-acetylmuramoyl-L-alanine amidase